MHPLVAATPPVMVQLIPAGEEVTTPLPVPVPVTVRVFFTTTAKSGSVGLSWSWQPCNSARIVADESVTTAVSQREPRMRFPQCPPRGGRPGDGIGERLR